MKPDSDTRQLIQGGNGHTPEDLLSSIRCIAYAIAIFTAIAALIWIAGLPGAQ